MNIKYFLIILLLVNSLWSNELSIKWYPIYNYKSSKIDKNIYQINEINKGNFTENRLYINSKNNFIIQNSQHCYYRSERSDIKIFDFNGTGSIQCDGQSIEFISVPLKNQGGIKIIIVTMFNGIIQFLLTSIPIFVLMGGIIVYLITHSKYILIITIILTILAMYLFLKNENDMRRNINIKTREHIYKIVEQIEKKHHKRYFIDPRLLPWI